jgi:hypothetical protein
MDVDMSSDFLGALCLALTVILALIAWHLAIRGLGAETDEEQGGDALQQKIENAKQAVAEAKEDLARARTGAESLQAASADQDSESARVAENATAADIHLQEAETSLGSISPGDALGPVKDALAALTGKQAPTRAFLAFALVTFIFSMVAFDVIDFSVASDQGDDTTTTTTASER